MRLTRSLRLQNTPLQLSRYANNELMLNELVRIAVHLESHVYLNRIAEREGDGGTSIQQSQ